MLIERLLFDAFGNLAGKRIDFEQGRLNLVLAANEYGKSTIAESIWAVLFDYPSHQRSTDDKLKERDARKPKSGSVFKASMDLSLPDQTLRIVRDFDEKSLRVFDRQNSDRDVTNEFLSGPNQDQLGIRLTGVGRDLFRNTSFVGQRALGLEGLSEESSLSAILQSISDASGAATTAAEAIEALSEALASFPWQGKKYRAERLISELELQREDIVARLHELDREKLNAREDLERLALLKEKVKVEETQLRALEYLHLCLEVADVDTRLNKASERLVKVNDLRVKMKQLSGSEEFPIASVKTVEELWTKREARLSDRQRLKQELDGKEKELSLKEMRLREQYESAHDFTLEDAQTVSGIGMTLQTVLGELVQNKSKLETEELRVRQSGIDLDSLSSVRKSLLNLATKDLDEAYICHEKIKKMTDAVERTKGSAWRAQMIANDILAERKHMAASASSGAMMSFVFLVVLILLYLLSKLPALAAIFPYNDSIPIAFGIGLTIAIVCVAYNSKIFFDANNFRKLDLAAAREEEERNNHDAKTLPQEIGLLNERLNIIARNAFLTDGNQLLERMQAYASAAPALKELDLLTEIIQSQESHADVLKNQLATMLTRAGYSLNKITPQAAFKLAEDINSYLEQSRGIKLSSEMLEHQRSELKFLTDEMRDLDSQLKEYFRKAKIDHPEDIPASYETFTGRIHSFRQWQDFRAELSVMERESTSDVAVNTLPDLIERLKRQRQAAWSKMEELIIKYPEIADSSDCLAVLTKRTDFAQRLTGYSELLHAYQKEKEELSIKVRASLKNYEEHYLKLEEQLENLEGQLKNFKQTKLSLELALKTFKEMAYETHRNWSQQLNEISKELLEAIGSDFESIQFDQDLQITVRRKGESEPWQPANIESQASIGTREQLYWLARMAICRFLGRGSALPIVLDEPFSELDDERFLKSMRFLLNVLVKEHQVIIFSCHQERHRWLMDQLTDDEKALINNCELKPLVEASVKI